MEPVERLSRSAQRVQQVLDAYGLAGRVVELPESTRTARDAARALGCEVAEIAKSLVFRRTDSGDPVLVVASGAHRVDEERLGILVGAAVEKADADFVRERLGYAIGGVPPVGHQHGVETWIDAELMKLGVVWAAAGTPRAVFRLTPGELAAITGGTVAPLAAS
jgi:prolyl-tRNA editing enzyme YbaK/EbsC (Cys-tRNA(Pro) deacylase)